MASSNTIKRLALLVGGGPAPGINGVIAAVTIEASNNRGIEVLGFRDGYKWLVRGYDDAKKHCLNLVGDDVRDIHNRGGSILGTSRTNPGKSPEDLRRVVEVLYEFGVDALVSIGGDDTASSASKIYNQAREMGRPIFVAHVPKTIDNDLLLPANTPTFGFETARHLGVGIVQNMMVDAQTTSRWYLIVSMGRNAGHLALGIGKAADATLTIIPEEFRGKKISFEHLCDTIIGSIIKSRASKRSYGVVVLAEGLISAVDQKQLFDIVQNSSGRYGTLLRDEFGHLRLGEIEFGKLIRELLVKRMEDVPALKTAFIDKDLGYELRCADPIPFDVEYTRDLGYGAVHYLLTDEAKEYGSIICYVAGKMQPLHFDEMLDPVKDHMMTRLVNVEGEGYECACKYMWHLEADDFRDPEKLAKLAATAGKSPDEFAQRFGYLVSC
jgi:6-phosphofructokinase